MSAPEHTVMPGLMDMHTHLQSQHSKDSYTERFFMEQADYALRSTVYARVTLMAGFTTVRFSLYRSAIGCQYARLAPPSGSTPMRIPASRIRSMSMIEERSST